MDFQLTDDQELFIESAREYAERYFTEEAVKQAYEVDHHISLEAAMAYREAGFMHLGLPEEVGGVPCSKLTQIILTEKLHEFTGTALPFTTDTNSITDVIDFGSKAQQELIMDAIENRESTCVASTAISEPAAGSDNNAMTCITVKQPDGTYLLNGQKTWVTNGENFPLVLLIAKDEDPSRDNREMSMWLVPLDTPGLTTAPLHKIGQQIMPFCDMYFDDVVLTEDMRVGKKGEGFRNLMKNFEVERCLICAQVLGLAQAAMDDAAAYASERICFGRPIVSFELIQQKLADMEIALQNTRNMLYRTLWKMDTGQSVRIDSALLKRYAAQQCTWVCSEALQIYGGLGFTTETRLGRLWLDCRGMQIAGGTDEIMVYIAGRQIAKEYAR